MEILGIRFINIGEKISSTGENEAVFLPILEKNLVVCIGMHAVCIA